MNVWGFLMNLDCGFVAFFFFFLLLFVCLGRLDEKLLQDIDWQMGMHFVDISVLGFDSDEYGGAGGF